MSSRETPISEPVYFILLSLFSRPLHGYALMKEIKGLSAGRVTVTTGTLFGAIKRMLRDGWIEPFAQADTSRDKQSYALTLLGRQRLEIEIRRLRELTAAASHLQEG